MKSLILFAHGARDPEWARPLQRTRESLRAQAAAAGDATLDVRLAFLEFMSPNLDGAIDEAVAAGANEVQVVPVFLAQGGHVKRDLPALLDAARARHAAVCIVLQPALGEAQAVIDALAGAALSAAQGIVPHSR